MESVKSKAVKFIKGLLVSIGAIVLLFVIIYMFVQLGSDKKSISSNSATETQDFAFTPKEQRLLKVILTDDITKFSDSGNNVFEKEWVQGQWIIATASTMQGDYERNEVAADKDYRGKTVFLTAVVTSIDRSIGDNYFLQLRGGSNPYMEPRAMMADGYIDYLSSLEKGQKIALVCLGDGMLFGSASVKNCKPTPDWVSAEVARVTNEIPDGLKDKNKTIQMLVFGTILLSQKLSDQSSCLSGASEKCLADIKRLKISPLDTKDPVLQAILKRVGMEKMPSLS